MGFGIFLAILIQLWRRRNDRFRDPTAGWMIDFIQEDVYPPNPATLSQSKRYELFLKRHNRQMRDQFGSESIYRVVTISNLVKLYSEERRYSEAISWQELAIKILEFNLDKNDSKIAAAYFELAVLNLSLAKHTEAVAAANKAITINRTNQDLSSLSLQLLWLFDAALTDNQTENALSAAQERTLVLEQIHGATSVEVEKHLQHATMAIAVQTDTKVPEVMLQHLTLLRNLNISITALGEDHSTVANDLSALGFFYHKHGRLDFSSSLLESSRMIRLLNKVNGPIYGGIEGDLASVAVWLKERNRGADRTVAFHLEKRAERIAKARKERAPMRR